VRSIVITVSVCLSVCPLAHLKNRVSKFHHIFCTCYLWPWRDLTTTQYSRFVDDVIFSIVERMSQNQRQRVCLVATPGPSLPSPTAGGHGITKKKVSHKQQDAIEDGRLRIRCHQLANWTKYSVVVYFGPLALVFINVSSPTKSDVKVNQSKVSLISIALCYELLVSSLRRSGDVAPVSVGS